MKTLFFSILIFASLQTFASSVNRETHTHYKCTAWKVSPGIIAATYYYSAWPRSFQVPVDKGVYKISGFTTTTEDVKCGEADYDLNAEVVCDGKYCSVDGTVTKIVHKEDEDCYEGFPLDDKIISIDGDVQGFHGHFYTNEGRFVRIKCDYK